MVAIYIALAVWAVSAIAHRAADKRKQREAERRYAEQQKVAQMVREDRQRRAEETARRIALEAEQMRQRREQEMLAKEQEKQAKAQAAAWEKQRREDAKRDEQIAKHDKRITDLEFKAEQASADIEHLRVVLDDLNESFELACQMADKAHNAGDTKREEQAKNKVITLRNKIHSAESRLAKAQHTREMAQRELAA